MQRELRARRTERGALAPGASAADAFQVIARACLLELVSHTKAVLAGDCEALHRMRIGLRRLRTVMSVFSEMIDDDESSHVKKEVRRLAQILGPARDADVLIADIVGPLRGSAHSQASAAPVARVLRHERAEAYRKVAAALRSTRFHRFVSSTSRWIERGRWVRSRSPSVRTRRDRPGTGHAAAELRRCRRRLVRSGKTLKSLDGPRLHKVRIRGKRLRYAVEFFAPLFPGPKSERRRRKTLSALEDLQDALGDLNDAVKQDAFLRRVRAGEHRLPRRHRFGTRAVACAAAQQHRAHRPLHRARAAYMRLVKVSPFWE